MSFKEKSAAIVGSGLAAGAVAFGVYEGVNHIDYGNAAQSNLSKVTVERTQGQKYIADFDLDGKKVVISRFEEKTDPKNPGWKTVVIFGESSQSLADEASSSDWTFAVHTKDGDFAASTIVIPEPLAIGPDGNADPKYPAGVMFTATIPEKYSSYWLSVSVEPTQSQDAQGGVGAASQSIPIKVADYSQNRT